MNSQTPETDAFLERHRQHNEDEMESTVEMLKRMECQRNAATDKVARLQALYDCMDPKGFLARKIEAILKQNISLRPRA